MTREEKAFLDTISYAEGTLGISSNGYDVLVNDSPSSGSRIIQNWDVNTKIQHGLDAWKVKVGNVPSTAAGRYQIIGETWISLNGKENKPMTKNNQDMAALKYLRFEKLLGPRFDFVISNEEEMKSIADKIYGVWSSFKTKSPKELFKIYKEAYNKY